MACCGAYAFDYTGKSRGETPASGGVAVVGRAGTGGDVDGDSAGGLGMWRVVRSAPGPRWM